MNDNDENRGAESDNGAESGEGIMEEDEESRHQEEQEQEQERRREIMGAMGGIPFDMDFDDGCVLLSLLHTVRKKMGHDRFMIVASPCPYSGKS